MNSVINVALIKFSFVIIRGAALSFLIRLCWSLFLVTEFKIAPLSIRSSIGLMMIFSIFEMQLALTQIQEATIEEIQKQYGWSQASTVIMINLAMFLLLLPAALGIIYSWNYLSK